MGSWSTLCTAFFAKRILSAIEKRVTGIRHPDGSALNVYYLLPSFGVSSQSPYYKQCDRIAHRLSESVKKDSSIVYPLARKEFLAQLWQTSARLLVLFEDAFIAQTDPEEFKQECSLITEFLADGGRVVLLVKPFGPPSSNTTPTGSTTSLNPAAVGNVVSTGDTKLLTGLFEGTGDRRDALWRWTVRSTPVPAQVDSPANERLVHMLIGSSSMNAVANLVALLIDCVDQNPHLLLEAANLLGVCCGSDPTNPKTAPPSSSLPNRIVLYTSVGTNGHQATIGALRTELGSNQAKSDVQYELRDIRATNQPQPDGFAWTDYMTTLRTRVLGRVLIWTESLPSSYELAERLLPSLPVDSGLVLVSNIQTKGKGRGSNRWISPVGQAAFTFHMPIRQPATLAGPQPPFPFMNFVTCMQHLVALAILLAGRRLLAGRLGLVREGEPEPEPDWLVDLKLPGPKLLVKWPNDVYVVEDNNSRPAVPDTDGPTYSILGKLAGLLTKCSMCDPTRVDCIAGCGINVNNELPSICLQHVLDRIQPSNAPLTVAEVIAATLNQMEQLIVPILDPRSTRGLDWLIDLYTRCWMHTNQRVLVRTSSDQSDSSARSCIIVGLDAFGYLRVRDVANGAQYTLHPDGNSMDMMRGLICPK